MLILIHTIDFYSYYQALRWASNTGEIIKIIFLALFSVALSVQLILIFVRSCPKWSYIGVASATVIYELYVGWKNISYVIEYGIEGIGSVIDLIINCIVIALSCMLVVIKMKPSRNIVTAVFIAGMICVFYLLVNDISLIVEMMDLSFVIYADFIIFIYPFALTICFVLMLRVSMTGQRCQCGYFYKKGAKFCGKCGKAI